MVKQVSMKYTVRLEVEKGWQKASIWKTGIRISKLIKEWVNECLNLDKSFKKILANHKVNKEMCNDISGVVYFHYVMCNDICLQQCISDSESTGAAGIPDQQLPVAAFCEIPER
jgi:hypothetical protein